MSNVKSLARIEGGASADVENKVFARAAVQLRQRES